MIPNRFRSVSRCTAIAVVVAIAATLATAQSAAAPTDLGSVILTPQQVGAGYKRTTFQGGRQVAGQVTLDLCGGDYPSEALRRERFQAVYQRTRNDIALSNEVVRYKAGGAAQAMAEVTRHLQTCPLNTPVMSPVAGDGAITYVKFQRLHDARLLPGAIALVIVMDVTDKGVKKRLTVTAVYQRRGDVFSGVYAQGGSLSKLKGMTLRVAAASATRLKHAA